MRRYNPFDPVVLPDPYPHYRWLREHDPVHWGAPGDPDRRGTWYLFRHAEVLPTLKDPRFGREVWRVVPPDAQSPVPEAYRPLAEMSQHWMILRDPPTHTRLRALVNKAFTPRMVEQIVPRIAVHAAALLAEKLPTGQIDLVADYARPLPVLVIAEILGIPPEDYRLFMPWSIDLAMTIDLRQSDEVRRRGTQAMVELCDYLRGVIALRRRSPRDDLISGLLQAEEHGRRLSEDEVLGMITMLLTAGNDPTMHLISNAVLTLLRHPEQLDRLRNEPDLLETALDELLRYDSCVQMTFRFALEDVVLGGKRLRAGDHVALVLGSALRDPDYCAEPDRLDITRVNNRLAFGLGIHFCLGMALARAEGQTALATLLREVPSFELAAEQLVWHDAAAVRGVVSLPLRFEAR
jgi:cytochrome P450